MNFLTRSFFRIMFAYLLSTPLKAAEILINFSGNLTLPTCQITVDESEKIFSLGSYQKRDFSTLTRTPGIPFHIDITTCAGNKKVSITFKGNEHPNIPGALIIHGQTAGAAIGLESDKGRTIRVNTDTITLDLKDSQGSAPQNRLSFKAYLIPITGGELKAGTFNASVNFELSYP